MSDIDKRFEDIEKGISSDERLYGKSYQESHLINYIMMEWCREISLMMPKKPVPQPGEYVNPAHDPTRRDK